MKPNIYKQYTDNHILHMHDMDTSHDHTNNTHSLRLGSFLLRIRPSMNQTFHESVRWKTIANRLHDRWGCHPPDHNYLPSRQTATLSVPVWITQSYIKTCCYQSLLANNLKCNHLHTHIKKLSSTWHTLHIQQPCLQSAPIACHAADNPASECQHTHQAHSQRNNIQVYICTPHYTSIATLWNTLTMPHK